MIWLFLIEIIFTKNFFALIFAQMKMGKLFDRYKIIHTSFHAISLINSIKNCLILRTKDNNGFQVRQNWIERSIFRRNGIFGNRNRPARTNETFLFVVSDRGTAQSCDPDSILSLRCNGVAETLTSWTWKAAWRSNCICYSMRRYNSQEI